MYQKAEIYLTKNQLANIAKAIAGDQNVNIKISSQSLKRKQGLSELYLTATQKNRINKAKRSNSGVVLKLSKAQLKHMKSKAQNGELKGGIIGALASALPIVLGSVGANLLGKTLGLDGSGAKKNKGSGIRMPGSGSGKGDGLFMPGTFKGRGNQGVPLNEFMNELGCCCKNNKVYVKKN